MKRAFVATQRRQSARLIRYGILAAVSIACLGFADASSATVMASSGIVDLFAPIGDEDRIKTLDLEVGKSLVVRTGFRVKRVSVGDPTILDVTVLNPKELQLVPTKVGSTNLLLWDVQGEVAIIADVNIGSTFTFIEDRINSVLDIEGVRVVSAGEAVILQGSVPSPVLAERAIAIAEAFFPDQRSRKVVNALDVGGNQQVMIEVIIAEMERTLGRNLSVNWSSIAESDGKIFAIDSFLGGLTAINERVTSLEPPAIAQELAFTDRIDLAGTFLKEGDLLLDFFIEAAQQRGLAKILARPTLLARSGQRASFLAGGEVPIPVAQGGAFGSITIEFKKFGVGVEFAPTVLGPDRIYLEVSPEVSEPDVNLGVSVGGSTTPGFTTRRASTSVELADGQSFAIAGLLQDKVREAAEKYPLLGDIPILGTLFRSMRFQRDETELVLIVTPRIVQPLKAEDIRLPTDSFVEPNNFEFYLLGALESQRKGEPVTSSPSGLIGPSGHRLPIAIEENVR